MVFILIGGVTAATMMMTTKSMFTASTCWIGAAPGQGGGDIRDREALLGRISEIRALPATSTPATFASPAATAAGEAGWILSRST